MDTNLVGSRGGNIVLTKTGLRGMTETAAKFNSASTPALINFAIEGVMYNAVADTAVNNAAWSSGHEVVGANNACVFAVWINAGNTVTTTQGPQVSQVDVAASRAVVPLPPVVADKALLGLIKVSTNNGQTFTAGTSCLNAANTTVTYYDTAFMPSKPFTS